MHQTFYIEADEEISSVIDKLRKSLSVENYFVITKRALIVQSVVNLKLLKKEAEKLKKSIIIVASDEQIEKIAQRAGITTVQASVEGIEFSEDIEDEGNQQSIFIPEDEVEFIKHKKQRLSVVGSADFYGNNPQEQKIEKNAPLMEKEILSEKKEHNPGVEMDVQKKPIRKVDDLRKNINGSERVFSDGIRKTQPSRPMKPIKKAVEEDYDLKQSFEAFIDPEKERKLERMFKNQPQETSREEKKQQGSGKPKNNNFIFSFTLFTLLVFVEVAVYLFAPKADVVVYLETDDSEVSTNVIIDINQQSVDSVNSQIPARIIEQESEITLVNDATGVGESAGQKAKGTVVIYNEYSTSPQQLVATTRFETEDGKIFRLGKSVSVPGMNNMAGQNNPGAIEVDVIADVSGVAYNIEPTSFTIPGFKGTDKYGKIYAKSAKAMMGGGISDDAVRTVSQADIDEAKKKTEEALRDKMVEVANSELKEGEILLAESAKFDISDSIASAKSGDLKNSFDYQVKAKMMIFAISEKNAQEIVSDLYGKDNKKNYENILNSTDMKVSVMDMDFENGKSTLKITAQMKSKPIFDDVQFKKQLAAKNENQIRELMDQYSQVKNLEININPVFLSKMPRFEGRINLEIRDFEMK